jgi:hypothetical protein
MTLSRMLMMHNESFFREMRERRRETEVDGICIQMTLEVTMR